MRINYKEMMPANKIIRLLIQPKAAVPPHLNYFDGLCPKEHRKGYGGTWYQTG